MGLKLLNYESKIADLALKLSDSIEAVSLPSKIWTYRKHTVVMDLAHKQERLAFDWKYRQGEWTGSVLGRTDSARRLLRNSLIGSYEMDRTNAERHILGSIQGSDARIVEFIYKKVRDVLELINKQTDKGMQTKPDPDCINVYWWDGKPNFGDVIGPWLVAKITNKTPINGRAIKRSSPPLMAVGSILNMLEQDDTVVWGSGLMNPLSEQATARLRSLNGISVRAVRGKLTREELIEKLDWKVPEVYGDPALLLPRFFPVQESNIEKKKIAIIPHYVHREHFQDVASESISLIDVHNGMERVVEEIAKSSVCISTSLHGLIIAQAYGVPWVWMRVTDSRLGGDTFKFRDFFSTLNSSVVSSIEVAKGDIGRLNFEEIAQSASLPELGISLDDLQGSFPRMHAEERHGAEKDSPFAAEKISETAQNMVAAIAVLSRKMDAMFEELTEQRMLLKKLSNSR